MTIQTRRGFFQALAAVVVGAKVVPMKTRDAHPTSEWYTDPDDHMIDAVRRQQRYNQWMSGVVEQVALAPKAPWVSAS